MNRPLAFGPFTAEQARAASDGWGFNCGPASLAALLGMTPDEIRPYLQNFEQKRVTTPTLICEIMRGLGVPNRRIYRSDFAPADDGSDILPKFGLVRLQFDGPWMAEGVPFAARYKNTHFVATVLDRKAVRWVFDINAIHVGGWLTYAQWREDIVRLIAEYPRATGDLWPTHCFELDLTHWEKPLPLRKI